MLLEIKKPLFAVTHGRTAVRFRAIRTLTSPHGVGAKKQLRLLPLLLAALPAPLAPEAPVLLLEQHYLPIGRHERNQIPFD